MASAIGTALISTILPPMAAKAMDIIKDKGKAIVRSMADKVMDNIERDISRLQETLHTIEGIVRVAEEKQINYVFVQIWLSDLVDISYEARDVLDDFITFSSCVIRAEEASNPVNFISSFMLSCFGGSSNDTSNIPLVIQNQLARDIRSVSEIFDGKKKEGETFATLKSVVVGGGSKSVKNSRPEVGPEDNKQRYGLFLGREEVKQEIMEKILHPSDDRVDVVVIWGMGGIGKTTLAQSIYNDERVKILPRSWSCVWVNKFSAEKVIREILNDQNTIGIGNLQTKLKEKLKGDRFLIVLDDVWDVDDSEWDLLFNPLTKVGKGGLIIITKRERELCATITIQTAYNLELLSEQDSWSIFKSRAFIDGNSDSRPDLKCIGKKNIVKKLNGLPLTLEVVGRSLLNKDSSTWTNFLESKFPKDDEVIMSALRWSYNHLPRHLKTCFTYCALFPKHHVFDKKVLVEMWMAHDLIQKEEQERPEDAGTRYFEQLVNASLLQCVDGKYTMHDLIHDLALLVSNGEFVTVNCSLMNGQWKKVRHITITPGDYSKIPWLCKIEKIHTLYTISSGGRNTKRRDVLNDVFKQLKSIRVLVLSSEWVCEIPDSISELRHLRYLDVSKTNVKILPDSLCRLYNLQMLAAPLDADLPRDVVNMVNLRYIRANLSTCKGVGKLISLRELSSIHVCEGDNIRELGDMQILHGKFIIKGLENVTSSKDGALMDKQTDMDELELVFNQHLHKSTISAQVLLDSLGCPPNLKYLRITGYNGLKLSSWMVDEKHKFYKLQTLELYDFPKLESLPPLGEMTSLKHLSLRKVGVKRLGKEYYGNFTNSKVFFPYLESLSFVEMEEWKEWDDIIIENSNVSFFPRLTTLEIHICPKLLNVLPIVKEREDGKHPIMTSLSRLEIHYCKGLKELQLDALASLNHLDISDCSSLVQITSAKGISLSHLRIWNCHGLKQLQLDALASHNHLDISHGSSLDQITLARGTFLSHLRIWNCHGLKELQLDALASLNHLDISDCSSLVQITSTICLATTIERLRISSCRLLEKIDFERLPLLKHLDVEGCNNLISIPHLVGIKVLNLDECESLRSLSIDIHGLYFLEHLRINRCPSLELAFEDGSSCSSSSRNSVAVAIHSSISLDNTQVFRTLLHHEFVSLKSLSIRKLKGFENFDEIEANNFCKLMSLESLRILQCEDLKSVPADFHKLSALKTLEINDCPQFQSLPSNFHELSSLEGLHILSCSKLQSLPRDFHKLSSLERLYIFSCPQLQSLPPDFHKLCSLKSLFIEYCPQLQSLPVDGLPLSLRDLTIEGCPSLYERCKDGSGLDWHKINHICWKRILP